MADPEMGLHTDVPGQPNEKRAIAFVNWMLRLNTTGRGRAWAMIQHTVPVGFLRLNRIDKKMSRAIVGYELTKPLWGQGLTTDAVRALVGHAHGALDIHRLEAEVFNGNTPSARVLEKAGFAQEGTLRSRIIHQGERRDIWLFGRLATDP